MNEQTCDSVTIPMEAPWLQIPGTTPRVWVALAALCGGTCYWPECREPVIRMIDGQPVSNLQIAHIRAAHFNGRAFCHASLAADETRAFANLILLAIPTTPSWTRHGQATSPS